MPDLYRGRLPLRGSLTPAASMPDDVKRQVEALQAEGRNPALFFSEGILGTGGQLVLPENYLSRGLRLCARRRRPLPGG